MMRCGVVVLLAAQSIAFGAAPSTAPAPRIVNIADDFLAYHDRHKSGDEAQRVAGWDAMIERRHAAFFDQVLYRGKKGGERERYKAAIQRQFWTEAAGNLDEVRHLNRDIAQVITRSVVDFRRQFADFTGPTDYYVTISLSFKGKVAEVDGRPVFALGLEKFQRDTPDLPITIAHELFHLYHFQTFSTAGSLYRMLWAEGLATFASAACVPGHRHSAYLGFTAERMDQCQKLLPRLAAQLRQNMGGEKDARLERAYFGAEDNDMGIPPAAGYYVGLLVCESLSRQFTVAQMARLDAKEAYRLVEGELRRLER